MNSAFDTHFAFQYHDVQQRFDTIVAFLCIAFISKLLYKDTKYKTSCSTITLAILPNKLPNIRLVT
jgi:hypothetical protein